MNTISTAIALMLGVVSAQTYPSNICSGGANDYLGTKMAQAATSTQAAMTCNELLNYYASYSPPTVWSDQACKKEIATEVTWALLLTNAQGAGCCTSYMSACAKYTSPAPECSGGQADFVGSNVGYGGTLCGRWQTNLETSLFAKATKPTYSGTWTAAMCSQIPDGGPTVAFMMKTYLNGCCTSGKTACDPSGPAPAPFSTTVCSGGASDFQAAKVLSTDKDGTTTCGAAATIYDAYNPPSPWTATSCNQAVSGSTTWASVLGAFSQNGCCKSGKSACDSPAPSPITAASCFSGEDTVQTDSGASMLFSELKIGDKVLTANSAGELSFADVVFLPHAANNDVATFVELATKSGKSIKATQMHLLQTCSGNLYYAKSLKIGDCLRTVDGEDQIAFVANTAAKGLYTAVTTNEFLVVNGVIASPFAVAHAPTHAFYNIHRALYSIAPGLLKQERLVSANALFGTSAAFAYSLFASSA